MALSEQPTGKQKPSKKTIKLGAAAVTAVSLAAGGLALNACDWGSRLTNSEQKAAAAESAAASAKARLDDAEKRVAEAEKNAAAAQSAVADAKKPAPKGASAPPKHTITIDSSQEKIDDPAVKIACSQHAISGNNDIPVWLTNDSEDPANVSLWNTCTKPDLSANRMALGTCKDDKYTKGKTAIAGGVIVTDVECDSSLITGVTLKKGDTFYTIDDRPRTDIQGLFPAELFPQLEIKGDQVYLALAHQVGSGKSADLQGINKRLTKIEDEVDKLKTTVHDTQSATNLALLLSIANSSKSVPGKGTDIKPIYPAGGFTGGLNKPWVKQQEDETYAGGQIVHGQSGQIYVIPRQ